MKYKKYGTHRLQRCHSTLKFPAGDITYIAHMTQSLPQWSQACMYDTGLLRPVIGVLRHQWRTDWEHQSSGGTGMAPLEWVSRGEGIF